MNLLSTIIGALAFGDTDNRLASWLRRAYFAICYNTTFPVNAMLVFGATMPYVLFLMIRGERSVEPYLAVATITLVSAYFYNLIYVVNDSIDRRKDELLCIPKQTARHVLGPYYLVFVAFSYAFVILAMTLVWPSLLLPLIGYGLILMSLSLIHSRAGRGKVITVFIERFVKFCSPFWLLYCATGNAEVMPMLAGAMMAYPLGFTADYAYRGYLRDRLKLGSGARFWLYGVYWAIVALGLALSLVGSRGSVVGFALRAFDLYLLFYFLIVALTYALADILPFGFLGKRYSDHVAGEKRRLLTYGLMQLTILALGVGNAAIH